MVNELSKRVESACLSAGLLGAKVAVMAHGDCRKIKVSLVCNDVKYGFIIAATDDTFMASIENHIVALKGCMQMVKP